MILERQEFQKGMGKNLFFATKEDEEAYRTFEALYEKNKAKPQKEETPKKIHLVWVGPNPYPEQSLSYLKSWQGFHPTWPINLWSDREREELPSFVTVRLITKELLEPYHDLYEQMTCLGAKSDLLRVSILKKEGGLYADHDIECRGAFDTLCERYPFFTSLLFAQKDHLLDRSILVKNSLLGARASHPTLERILQEIKSRFDPKVPLSTDRTLKQSFFSFHKAILEEAKKESFDGIILPPSYFLMEGKKFGLFAREDIARSWHPDERAKIAYLELRLEKVKKRLCIAVALSAFLLLALFLSLFLWI
ncbi:MAG: hypothetical protein JSR76_08040 [Verrucomicrobia bacterium]|nr:hypothetical protein [Verrucomicrobiota bacterium]